MCQRIIDNDTVIQTIADFRKHFPKVKMVKCATFKRMAKYDCLCVLDIENTLKKAGFDYEIDGMDFIIEQKESKAMSTQLDLDDVAATSELAKRQLYSLRADNMRMREALDSITKTVHSHFIGNDTSFMQTIRAIKMCSEIARDAIGKE